MKRKFTMILVCLLALSILTGCAGTPVIIAETENQKGAATVETAAAENSEQAVKTGLAVFTKISEEEGNVKYDITLAAVTVDDTGVIRSARIDSVPATVKLEGGTIATDLTAPILSKKELGADYGMVAYGGAVAEWDAQAQALCDFAVGKTVEQLKSGAVDETGHAPQGSDLASSATIYLGGYVSALEAAVNNAQHLGAQSGDGLALAAVNSLGKSKDATAEANGNVQLYTTIAVVTSRDGVITSCYIDAVQADAAFDAAGTIVSDLSAPVRTKNQLGEAYGMKAKAGAIAEWNEQAASFAAYVTGKTADEVAGIAVDEKTAPVEADLTASVTIKIGDFKTLIDKALN